jgi:hypothetical protein
MIEATLINNPVTLDINIGEETPILPKKRGRKPKNRDIPNDIKNIETTTDDNIEKLLPAPKKSFFLTKIENTILHFPIKTEIGKQIASNKSNFSFSNQPIDIQGPSAYDPSIYVNMHADFENVSHSFAFVNPEPKKNLTMNAINKNVKIIPLLKSFIDCNGTKSFPEKTDICCFLCTEGFDNPPVGLPEKKIGDTFFVKHCFCNYNCMARFNFDINDDKMWERYALINLMYKKQYNLTQNIKVELSPPREALIKFGGAYTIDQFRDMCHNKSVKIMSFPVISVQTYLEEMNNQLHADNLSSSGPSQSEVKNYLEKVNDQYKLSRNTKNESKNTLEFCMGLKKV